jgi:hypothetical protein
MNLEFMCCILFGLTEIFMKPERKKLTNADEVNNEFVVGNGNDNTITIHPQSSVENLLNSREREITNKDCIRAKSHKIRYKKIFDENIDIADLEVEVTPLKKKKMYRGGTIESSLFDSDSQSEDIRSGSKAKGKQKKADHDAMVIEYCPKVFRELRKLDDIEGHVLER